MLSLLVWLDNSMNQQHQDELDLQYNVKVVSQAQGIVKKNQYPVEEVETSKEPAVILEAPLEGVKKGLQFFYWFTQK